MILLKPSTLTQWLDKTASQTNLVAPKRVDGVLLYRPVGGSQEIVWDYIRPVLSAKEFFFPATERLLTIEKQGRTIHLQETLPEGYQVLFGVRPCDARGIAALDALFIGSEPVDANYAARRRKSVIVSLACDQVGETCFCDRTGSGPDDPTGSDILLKRTQNGYHVQVLTEAGLRLASQGWGLANAEITPNEYQAPPSELPALEAWPPQFNDAYWADMSERCLSCRVCAYVCPTCRCFDVRDEALPSENGHQQFERIRCWDSCAGTSYRKIAGGHNPRAEKGQRLRNRFFCKFYYYPEQYGPTACTGCGRCIDSCPVNIDITEVMSHVVAGSPV
jgi:ferredoxin